MSTTETVGSSNDPSAETAFERPTLLRDATICAVRNLRRLSRSPVTLVQSIAFPAILLTVLLIAFGRVIGGTIEAYSQRLVPQLVVSAGAFGAAGTGLAVYADRTSGMIDRLRSLPTARGAFLTGTVAADSVRALVAAAIMVLVGHLPGFRFEQGPLAALGFFAVAVVFGLSWAWLAVLIGLTARAAEAVSSVMNGPILMLFFLSSGFVPVDGFPSVVQPIVRINPISCAVNAMMGLSGGGPVLAPVLQTFAWTVVLCTVFATLALRKARTLA